MKNHDHASQKLLIAVILRFLMGLVIFGVIFFSTAGSFSYIYGWIYLGTISLTLVIGLIILFNKDKSLLEKRIKITEKDPKQKMIVVISVVLITAIYAIPGLDYRFKWTTMPVFLIVIGEIVLLLGYAFNLQVMLINSYASRVVEIQENQRVIDTGLYSIVRHPMYLSIILVYIGTCFILGSYIAFFPCILMIFTLGFRAVNEEKILIIGLNGYKEYMERVKYRFFPYLW